MESTVYQATAADRAFETYYFGNGVEVADVSGWEYTTPGYERTRKVYVETEMEDDGPAPRCTLNFTVRFDPATGALVEATATDSKGQTWGTLAAVVILQLKELATQIDPDTRPPIVPVHLDGDRLNRFVVVQGDASDLKEVTMTTPDPKSTEALQLRTQALALLEEAQQLDGLKPYTVTHSHCAGNSTYIIWAASMPSEEQAKSVLDSEFEPWRDEHLTVEGHHFLDEMAGASVTSRLPDILESFSALASSEETCAS